MQLQRHTAFNERILYYWAKTYASRIKTSDPYKLLKKVIQIIIVDFDLLPSCGVHSTFLLTESSSGTIFSDHLEIHALQLSKTDKKTLHDMNNLEKWLLFFKGNQLAKEEVAMESSAFKEAFEENERLSRDPETVRLAISREIELRDHIQRMQDAEERGMEKGSQAKMIDMVLRLHKTSTPIYVIAEAPDLSMKEVQEIIEKRKD